MSALMMDSVSNRGRMDIAHFAAGLNVASPAVAVFEISLNSVESSMRRHYCNALTDCLEQAVPDGSIVIMNGEEYAGLLFSWDSQSTLHELKRKLEHRFLRPVSIGIGLPCRQFSDIFKSFGQALIALRDKFYKGAGDVIFFHDVPPYRPVCVYPAAKEEELLMLLKLPPHGQSFDHAVKSFYDTLLEDGPIEIKALQEMTIRLMFGLEKRILSETGQSQGDASCDILSVVHMETLHQIQRYVSDFLHELHKQWAEVHHENNRGIIQKTIQYMEQECRHATLNSVAEKVFVTPTYLSLLFKMNTGRTFIEHLTDIRIRKAKDLLKSTYLKNYEVAEQVGYHDSRYFSQVFKKKVGLSPSEFRESLSKRG